MNKLGKLCILYILLISGCYAEFDLGTKTPRTDMCTGKTEVKYVYWDPPCRTLPPPVPQPNY